MLLQSGYDLAAYGLEAVVENYVLRSLNKAIGAAQSVMFLVAGHGFPTRPSPRRRS